MERFDRDRGSCNVHCGEAVKGFGDSEIIKGIEPEGEKEIKGNPGSYGEARAEVGLFTW